MDLPDLVVETDDDAHTERHDDHVSVHAERVRLQPDATPTRFCRHGWQSWSQTRWLSVAEPTFPVPVEELRVLDDDPVHAR